MCYSVYVGRFCINLSRRKQTSYGYFIALLPPKNLIKAHLRVADYSKRIAAVLFCYPKKGAYT